MAGVQLADSVRHTLPAISHVCITHEEAHVQDADMQSGQPTRATLRTSGPLSPRSCRSLLAHRDGQRAQPARLSTERRTGRRLIDTGARCVISCMPRPRALSLHIFGYFVLGSSPAPPSWHTPTAKRPWRDWMMPTAAPTSEAILAGPRLTASPIVLALAASVLHVERFLVMHACRVAREPAFRLVRFSTEARPRAPPAALMMVGGPHGLLWRSSGRGRVAAQSTLQST